MTAMVELAGSNGTVVKAPQGELGTADDMNPLGRLFLNYEDGKVLDRPDPNADNYETMLRRDGKARAIEQVLTLPLRWADMSVVPQEGDKGEAELVERALTRPANAGGMTSPLDLVIGQMTSAVMMRRAFFEKVFGLDERGCVVYRKLAFRPARTCTLRREPANLSFDGFVQKARKPDGDVEDVPIPAEKAFVYIHGQHRNPLTGSSDMETVWSCFESKQKVRFLWMQFLERNVIPYGVLKTKDDKATRVREVAKLKNGGVVGLDLDESLEPFEAAGQAGESFNAALDWLSAEMSVSVLASFTDLAQQGSGKGSLALSKDQTDFFLRSRQAVLKEMGASMTAWVAADLVRWNFGPGAKAPQIVFSDLAGHDAQAARELFSSIATGPPSPQVPQAFTDELIELVAKDTGMNLDKIRRAIEERQAQAPATPVARLGRGLDAAAQLMAEAGVGGGAVGAQG